MGIAAKIEMDDLMREQQSLARLAVSPHRMAAEIGPRCTRLVQRNFRKLGQNARGWPSTHFWGRAAAATNWQEGFGFVIISVNQIGVRQRLMGGDILPVNAKMLTIPAHPDAYGKRASEFGNLKFAFAVDPETGRMRPALVAPRATSSNVEFTFFKSGKNKGLAKTRVTGQNVDLLPLFWLAKGVHQEPDPAVMPSDEEFFKEFDKSIEVLLRRPARADGSEAGEEE